MLCNHLDKYALRFNKDLNGGCMSRLGRMPVDTARYNASDFAEDLVKQSDKQSADDTCARSFNLSRARFLTEHLNHMDCFLLLWQASSGSCGNQVVSISPHLNSHARGTDVHPQTTKKLTGSKHFVNE